MLKYKPAASCAFDALSLGEIMLRFDPGDGRIHTARQFKVWEGGGEYNVVRGLRRCFGLRSARGSSSRAGAHAQLEAARALKSGYHVAFTPDGPRGPRYHMSKGPIHLASMYGTCVLPVAVNASRYWECRSWDRFQIPKPFCKLQLVIGKPITIPPDLDAEGLAKRISRPAKWTKLSKRCNELRNNNLHYNENYLDSMS